MEYIEEVWDYELAASFIPGLPQSVHVMRAIAFFHRI